MSGITASAVIIRFILGGSAVAAAFVLARLLGSRWGGIFAAFPAVYIAAIVTVTLGLPAGIGTPLALQVSQGALVGMISNIICAIAASRLILQQGWKRGLASAIGIWLVCAIIIYETIIKTGILR